MVKTLKEMGIKRVIIHKHGVPIYVYKYKGKFYSPKQYAIDMYEKDHK
ncbi:hypothetical protein LCGC14_1173960 [marine sediment metagenome]|uniref:Uncharacterized protein n=1 Tax=marine sediment metagenome TaxID=412755 RepID=A0A0F9P767_9ZZZZ